MSHNNKITLQSQANERFKSMAHFGDLKKSEVKEQAVQAYVSNQQNYQTQGITRADFVNDAVRPYIFSYKTYDTYMSKNAYFFDWCKQNLDGKDRRTLDQVQQHVPQYLESLKEKGLSASTIKTYAAGLAKLYQCDVRKFGVELPNRSRADITRSREPAERDRGFSLKNNAEYINFCRGTGLRQCEMRRLTPEQLQQKPNGEYFLKDVHGKGGRLRDVPIIGPHSKEIVDRIQNTPDGHKVWQNIPSHADTHSYRSDYCTAIYSAYARDINSISDKHELYYCRNDRAGEVFDRVAMRIASEALGHSREGVIASHYLR